MPLGRKNLTVRIPQEIIEGGQNFIVAALRGIADQRGRYFSIYDQFMICPTHASKSVQQANR
jgi:hypothetical protein